MEIHMGTRMSELSMNTFGAAIFGDLKKMAVVYPSALALGFAVFLVHAWTGIDFISIAPSVTKIELPPTIPLPRSPEPAKEQWPAKSSIEMVQKRIIQPKTAEISAIGQTVGAKEIDRSDKPPAQIVLTEKQIEGVLAAAKEMDPITEKLPDNGKPDAKLLAQLDGVAKKNGFANYDDYNNVIDNVSLVMAGFDPATKTYVGSEAIIKAQIAQVQADTKMSAEQKSDALNELTAALKFWSTPVANASNIALIAKYGPRLVDVFSEAKAK
jgi:hypothetical protein